MEPFFTDAHRAKLLCEAPPEFHRVCAESLARFLEEGTSVHTPAWTCNMVDSSLIPLVECLLNAYADGILLPPFMM